MLLSSKMSLIGSEWTRINEFLAKNGDDGGVLGQQRNKLKNILILLELDNPVWTSNVST